MNDKEIEELMAKLRESIVNEDSATYARILRDIANVCDPEGADDEPFLPSNVGVLYTAPDSVSSRRVEKFALDSAKRSGRTFIVKHRGDFFVAPWGDGDPFIASVGALDHVFRVCGVS